MYQKTFGGRLKIKNVKIGIFKTDESLESALKEALKAADWTKHIRGTVFIKPNLCSKYYIRGAVTNPQVLFHLVRILRDQAEEVIVGESNGYNYCCNTALALTGVKKIVEKAGFQDFYYLRITDLGYKKDKTGVSIRSINSVYRIAKRLN